MPKKIRNGFYFFMKDLQEKEHRKGRRIPISSMPNLAHPIWKEMSAAEREPYDTLARMSKNDPNFRGAKLASDGTSIEDNRREQLDLEAAENEMQQDIARFLNVDASVEVFKESTPRRFFYFLSFNILYKTEHETIPLEIGLVEYSIQNGINRELHVLLAPAHIQCGFTGDAKRLSEEKHQIDIFKGEEGSQSNVRDIYDTMKSFMNPTGCDAEPEPVFCVEDNIETDKECLKWLQLKADVRDEINVWNAKYLLMELRSAVKHPLPSSIIASDLLTKPAFNYHPAARCSFHAEKDNHNCALAYSKTLCYLLSDAVCGVFDVTITEKHIPPRAVEEKEYVIVTPKVPKPYPRNSRLRLDQRNTYYENQFEDAAPISVPKPAATRYPVTDSVAAEMSRLNLEMSSATVPGHGIGRGQKHQ